MKFGLENTMNVGILRTHLVPTGTSSIIVPQCCNRSPRAIIVSARHVSSYRRTKKRVVVAADASFRLSRESPQQDHIIFNPPSSAPSYYHTPFKFLPKDDSRRDHLSAIQRNRSTEPDETQLPPALSDPYEKKYHLTKADIEEMRRLRKEDAEQWTRYTLARKFNCTPLFAMMVCRAAKLPPSSIRRAEHEKTVEAVQSRWGRKRREAREDRARRKALWGRDEDAP